MVDLDTLEHRRIELSSIKENGPSLFQALGSWRRAKTSEEKTRED